MTNQLTEIKFADLAVGDKFSAVFQSYGKAQLFLEEEVALTDNSQLISTLGHNFYVDYNTFFLIEKAVVKRELPTEFGSLVKHTDGWQFIRVGLDSWKGIHPGGEIARTDWSNAEVASSDWEEIS